MLGEEASKQGMKRALGDAGGHARARHVSPQLRGEVFCWRGPSIRIERMGGSIQKGRKEKK